MPLYQEPRERKESYTLSGNGAFVLTEEQRSARSITVLAEKVKPPGALEYYNYRLPEPRSFWGYCQWVSRDYITETISLEYRRQVMLAESDIGSQQNSLQNCLIIQSQRLAYQRLLDLLGIGGVTQQDRDILLAEWKTAIATPALVQRRLNTALWHEIEPNFTLKLTVIWVPFSLDCDELAPLKIIAGPRGTEKDEERPAPGGGGNQPAQPLPPERSSDPLSDSSVPPLNDGSPPPSPTPAPALKNTTVTIEFPDFWDNTQTPCARGLRGSKSATVPGIWPLSAFAIKNRSTEGLPPPRCAGTRGYLSVIVTFNGQDLAGTDGGPVEYGADPVLSVSYS